MKTILVVGSAPCLYDDVERAQKLRPFASMFLVNGACTAFENVEHVLAGHEEKAEFFQRERKAKFPNARPWELHGCTWEHRRAAMKQLCPSVTQWWPIDYMLHATSASKAIKIALTGLDYDEAILCGCPMDGGGYYAGEAVVPHETGCYRVGHDRETGTKADGKLCGGRVITPPHKGEYSTQPGAPMLTQETKIIRLYRTRFKELAETPLFKHVYSMSGFTRSVVGEPPERN